MDQLSNHPLYKRHNLDSAMSSLWSFYKKHFLQLFIISFVMSIVMQYASTMVNVEELSTITDPMAMLSKMKELLGPILIISVVNLLFTMILQYYILYKPLEKDLNIFLSALKSMKYFIPYLIILILLSLVGAVAIVLGILVLIVGVFFSVLYITMIFLFILPIMMAEETNISQTITRIIALAHRNFWSNIGWVAVFLIILIVVSIIFSGLILIPFTGSFLKTITNPAETSGVMNMTKNPLFIILSALSGALTFPVLPIFSWILYFNGKAGETQNENSTPVYNDNDKVRVEDLYAKPYSDDHPDNPDNK
jgi:hypothetical protein